VFPDGAPLLSISGVESVFILCVLLPRLKVILWSRPSNVMLGKMNWASGTGRNIMGVKLGIVAAHKIGRREASG
jgi:hypothetical protein